MLLNDNGSNNRNEREDKMVNPYTKENPGNFANDRKRASEAGKKGGKAGGKKGGQSTSERYLDEARQKNRK